MFVLGAFFISLAYFLAKMLKKKVNTVIKYWENVK